jgi:hypothetical protein
VAQETASYRRGFATATGDAGRSPKTRNPQNEQMSSALPEGDPDLGKHGRYAQIATRSDLPKFGSNNRAAGTADENKAVVQGSIAYFGTYTVNEADKSFTVQVEGSTFPNWPETAQNRPFSISGDDLTFTTAVASIGGSNEVKWKRVK